MLRQTLLYLPAQLLGPLAMFVAAVVWTHLLDAGTYGVVSYVLAAQEVVYMLTIAWWSLYVLRYRAVTDEGWRRRLVDGDNAVVLLGAGLQVVAALPILAALHVPLSAGFVLSCAVLFATRSLLTHYSEIARAEEAIAVYTIAQLTGPLIGTAASFVGVIVFGASPTAALAGIAVVQSLGLVAVMIGLRVEPKLRRPDRAVIGEALVYGLPILASGMLGWVAVNGIRLAVDEFAGAEALGLLSVGWGLGQRVASVAAMLLAAAAFPIAVRLYESGDEEGARRQLSINGSLLFALLAPTTAGVTMIARPLVELMIAEPFRAATIAVLPLSVLAGAVRNLRSHFADQSFLLHGRPNRLVPLGVVEAVACSVGTVAGLVGVEGGVARLVAATLGCFAGIALAAGLTFAVAIRTLGLRPRWGDFGRILVATAAMCAVLALVPSTRGVAGLVGTIVLGMASYGVALALLFPQERDLLITKLRALLRRGDRAGLA